MTDDFETNLARRVRDAYTEVPAHDVAQRHIAAMVREPVTQPAAIARGRWRRRAWQVAAIAVGGALASSGLAYAGVDSAPNPVEAAVNAVRGGPPDNAAENAREHKAVVNDYHEAVKTWTDCVKTAAAEHEGEEAFDPEAACGPKPNPHDFEGMTGPSSRADEGQQTADDAKSKHEDETGDATTTETDDPHPGAGNGRAPDDRPDPHGEPDAGEQEAPDDHDGPEQVPPPAAPGHPEHPPGG